MHGRLGHSPDDSVEAGTIAAAREHPMRLMVGMRSIVRHIAGVGEEGRNGPIWWTTVWRASATIDGASLRRIELDAPSFCLGRGRQKSAPGRLACPGLRRWPDGCTITRARRGSSDQTGAAARPQCQAVLRPWPVDEAIAEYREAYRLRSDPAFLFNIAQSYRRKGDLQPALDLYKNYLIENPTTPSAPTSKSASKRLRRR